MQPTRNKNLTSAACGQATASAPAPLALDDLRVARWAGRALWHGFLGRRGGISRGPYESLNLSYLSGDDPAAVRDNWRRLHAYFPPDTQFAQVHQVHGNRVHAVSPASNGVIAIADGMVSAVTGINLGILTADCVPVLLYDQGARVVGALHAGWRGVISDIASAGINAMAALGARPEHIEAALGPAIGFCCFEVDIALARRFEAELPGAASHVRAAGSEKAFIDLKGVLRDQFTRAGLKGAAISSVPACTRCSSERFFSRRAAGGGLTGLQLSFIGLRE